MARTRRTTTTATPTNPEVITPAAIQQAIADGVNAVLADKPAIEMEMHLHPATALIRTL